MKPARLWGWLVILVVAIACTADEHTSVAEITAATPFIDTQRVIFPAEMVEAWWWLVMGYDEAGESWTPNEGQVARLETTLIPFLKTADDPWLRPDPPLWERVGAYRRQHIGVIEGGRQVIYGNYFCRSRGDAWQQEIEWVDDGGDCYFQIKYDIEAEMIYELHVNGEA